MQTQPQPAKSPVQVPVTAENFAHVAGRDKRAQIAEEIRYLVDKGYLREIAAKRDALDHSPPTVYQLTARGVELLNGDIEDGSIEL